MSGDERFWVRQRLLFVFAVAVLLYVTIPAAYRLYWSRDHRYPCEINEGEEIDLRSVDVNRGDDLDLAGLPGIGPTLARRIIADREQNGPFTCLKDLERVRGIGPETSRKIKPYVFFESGGNTDRFRNGVPR